MPIRHLPPLRLASVGLLAITLGLLPFLGGGFRPAGEAMLFGLAAFSLAFWAMDAARNPFALVRPPLASPVALFAAVAILSLLWTLSLSATLLALSQLSFGLLLFLLVWWHGQEDGSAVVLLAAALAGASAAALMGVREYASNVRIDPTWRAFGPFFNPNLLANYVAMALPVTLAAALVAEGPAALLAGTGAALELGALLVSGSRGGLLAAACATATTGGLLAIRTRRRPPTPARLRAAAIRGLVMLVLLGGVTLALQRPVAVRVGAQAGAQAGSNEFRLLTWRGTLDLIRDRPLTGWGWGTFELAYPRRARAGFTEQAHNSYLQIAAEGGLVALLAWLWLCGGALAGAGRAALRTSGPGCAFAAGIAGGLIASLVHNGFDYGWYATGTSGLFWAFLGAAAGVGGTAGHRLPAGELGTPFDGEPRPLSLRSQAPGRRRSPLSGRARPDQNAAQSGATAGAPTAAGQRGRSSQPQAEPGTRPTGRQGSRAAALFAAGILILTAVLLVPGVLFGAGSVYAGAEDAASSLALAQDDLQRALALYPLSGDWHRRLAQVLAADGSPDRAIEEAKDAVRLDPANALNPYWLGRIQESLGNPAAAEAAYRRALHDDPNSTHALVALGGLLAAQHRDADAEAAYRRVTEIENSPVGRVKALAMVSDPDYPLARLALAQMAKAQGRWNLARREATAGIAAANEYLAGLAKWRAVYQATNSYPTQMEAAVRDARAKLQAMSGSLPSVLPSAR